jgi:hypothetical protein
MVPIKVFDHIFPHKLTLKFLGDYFLTPCICSLCGNAFSTQREVRFVVTNANRGRVPLPPCRVKAFPVFSIKDKI